MTGTDLQDRARAWFETLRDRICAAFEAIEDDCRLPGSGGFRPAASSASHGTGPAAAVASWA